MPTKRLPSKPNLDNLKRQARELLSGCAARDPRSCQVMREFHPRFAGASDDAIAKADVGWSDGLFAIAREYGFASWPRLKVRVESARPGDADRPLRDRIADPVLRQAVDALDDGDIETLRHLLTSHPNLVTRRAEFEGENYFRSPSLLMFAAENPVRNDCLPPNIVEIAKLILDFGAARNRADVDETLALVASGRVAREAGRQKALIVLLVAHGADPSRALNTAVGQGEFEAVAALLQSGAPLTLPTAAALGDAASVSRLLIKSSEADRHLGLAFAAQYGRDAALQILLDAGEDPNRFNPPGAHSHSTPLHQAALNGHEGAVRLLMKRGARLDIRDTLWNGTPIDWARHGGRDSVVALLTGASA